MRGLTGLLTGWRLGPDPLPRLAGGPGRLAAWRVINQVVQMGWLPLGERQTPDAVELDGLWINGDCTYANDPERSNA